MLRKLNHPKGLMVLFFTEMWERFSYYGMRALLVLYLTSKVMDGGFGLERSAALEIYAIFTGLVYLTPIFGGLISDKLLGQIKSIYIGGIIMAFGNLALAFSELGENMEAREWFLNFGLGLLILGNGFFKPNISTIVGKLYSDTDPRKDSAFTIFYMGVNIGALIAPITSGWLGENISWFYGFLLAAIGMITGVLWFFLNHQHLGSIGFPPSRKFGENKADPMLFKNDWMDIATWIIGSCAFLYAVLKGLIFIPEAILNIIFIVAAIAGVLALSFVILKNTTGTTEWSRVSVILILTFFNIFFWAGFEQAGGTFNLFALESTNRMIFDWEIPASWFQSINPLCIILFAPVASALWIGLGKIGKNPIIPVKFSYGFLLLGFGFVIMQMAGNKAGSGITVSPMWLVLVYLAHTLGELCLSPIGLSMISKLSPPRITTVMMGLFFGSTALANYMAGVLENILHKYLPNLHLFYFLTITSLATGIVLLLISPILKKMMKGVE